MLGSKASALTNNFNVLPFTNIFMAKFYRMFATTSTPQYIPKNPQTLPPYVIKKLPSKIAKIPNKKRCGTNPAAFVEKGICENYFTPFFERRVPLVAP
jgi:hypothetical protein